MRVRALAGAALATLARASQPRGRALPQGSRSGLPHGHVSFAPGDLYEKLKPGRYVAGLFLDDAYSLLARTTFRVR
jgi:hypothetical protein